MTPVELHAALESLNLTYQQLARLLGYDERTVRYWLAGDRGIPSAVAILVRLLISGKTSFRDVDKAKPR
jgi:DNA-binding transcriptional regulator YiaG